MKDRTTAVVVGLLFLAADVAGVVSLTLLQPITGAHDYLTQASQNGSRVATGALLVLVMGVAVVAIAVAIYPVLGRFSQRLALGYVVARAVEGVVDVLAALAALLLLSASQQFVGSGGSSAPQALAGLLRADSDWVSYALMPIVFGLDALILNYALYRARLVPRWLSVWGLAGAGLWLAAGVMVTYGLQTSAATPMAALIGVQEIALAAWLIFKGFNRTDFAGEAEPASARTWRTA